MSWKLIQKHHDDLNDKIEALDDAQEAVWAVMSLSLREIRSIGKSLMSFETEVAPHITVLVKELFEAATAFLDDPSADNASMYSLLLDTLSEELKNNGWS